MDNFRLPETPGFALYQTARDLWALSDPVHGGNRSNVIYNTALDAVMLTPENPTGLYENMSLASVALTPTLTMDAKALPDHLNANGTALTYLVTKRAETGWPGGNGTIGIESVNADASADPMILLNLLRKELPPQSPTVQTADRVYSFTFGGGYTIAWSTTAFPTFQTPDGTVYTNYLNHPDWASYTQPRDIQWVIVVEGDSIYLSSNILPGTWTIRQPNGMAWNVPKAKWAWTSINGGMYALNISVPQFNTSGYLITKWIDTYHVYSADDLEWQHYPPFTNSLTYGVSWTIYDSRSVEGADGAALTQHRYLLSVFNDDGTRTPYLRALQFYYPPTFRGANNIWTDISPYVTGYSDTLTSDLTPNQCQITFDLQRRIYNASTGLHETLFEYLGGPLAGMYSFHSEMGFTHGDGTVDTHDRMTGVISVRNAQSSITEKTITVTAYDRWAVTALNNVLFPPCGVNMEPHVLLSLWLQFAGIAPGDIIAEPIEAIPATAAMERIDYSNPPWRPEFGGKLDEYIRRYCLRMGMRVDHLADGMVWVHPYSRTGDAVTHLTTDRTEAYNTFGVYAPEHALTTVAAQGNSTDAINRITVKGKDKDGNAIFYTLEESDAWNTGSDLYMGIWSTQVIADDDLMTEEQVVAACWEAFLDRKSGLPVVTVTTPYALWDAAPGDFVTITDNNTGLYNRKGRIKSLGIGWSVATGVILSVQATIEITEAGNVNA